VSSLITADALYLGMFWFLTVVTIGSTIAVVSSRDLARAIFMLLFSLGGVAGFYAWLGADFLFGVQLLIYVGGILVILIFAMMVSQQFPLEEEEPDLNKDIAGFTVSMVIFACIGAAAFATPWPSPNIQNLEPTTALLGETLLSSYLLPFEAIAVVLLIALVAATLLTRRDDEHSDEPRPGKSPGGAHHD